MHNLLEKTVELDSKKKEESTSPFNDLYQMIKKSLHVKTPRRSLNHQQTPSSRFCSPKPKDEIKALPVEIDSINNGTPKSVKKQRNSCQVPSNDISMGEVQNAKAKTPSVQKSSSVTPQRLASSKVEQVTPQNSKSTARRSKEATPAKQAETSPETKKSRTKASPRNFGNVETGNYI